MPKLELFICLLKPQHQEKSTIFYLEFDTLGSIMDSGLGQKKRKGATRFIDENLYLTYRENLDALIAKIFYTSGLSFNLARTHIMSKPLHMLVSIRFRVLGLGVIIH